MAHARDKTYRVDGNKAGRVQGGKGRERVHRRVLLAVEVAGVAAAADDVRSALVHHHAHLAGDVLLRLDDGCLDKLALGRKVHAVVQLAAPRDGDKLVAQLADLAVHDEALEVNVREAGNRQARGVV